MSMRMRSTSRPAGFLPSPPAHGPGILYGRCILHGQGALDVPSERGGCCNESPPDPPTSTALGPTMADRHAISSSMYDAPHLARNAANHAPLTPISFLVRSAATW